MTTTLELRIKGLPPCPRNRSHRIGIKKFGAKQVGFEFKTEAATSYEKALAKHLWQYVDQIEDFSRTFDQNKHALSVEWIHWTPDFYTKTGKVSENSVDLDAHKILQDVIASAFQIDDAYITDNYSKKRYKATHELSVRLTILDLKDLDHE